MGDKGLETLQHVKANPGVSVGAANGAVQMSDPAKIAAAVGRLTTEERAALLAALGGVIQ